MVAELIPAQRRLRRRRPSAATFVDLAGPGAAVQVLASVSVALFGAPDWWAAPAVTLSLATTVVIARSTWRRHDWVRRIPTGGTLWSLLATAALALAAAMTIAGAAGAAERVVAGTPVRGVLSVATHAPVSCVAVEWMADDAPEGEWDALLLLGESHETTVLYRASAGAVRVPSNSITLLPQSESRCTTDG